MCEGTTGSLGTNDVSKHSNFEIELKSRKIIVYTLQSLSLLMPIFDKGPNNKRSPIIIR